MEFPPGFFRKETRWDFEISEMMKRAWAAELEVLEVVKAICQKHGLHYFGTGGTAIGTVRHHGFIPWDDDIDIAMKRKEYQELVRILPQELPKGFEMAGMYADTEYWRQSAHCWYTRVVADGEQWELTEWMKYFHGFPYQRVGIDIFPVDYIPRDDEEYEVWKSIIFFGMMILQSWEEFSQAGKLENYLQKMEELCTVSLPRSSDTEMALRRLIDSVAATYEEEEADEMIQYQWSYLSGPRRSMKKEYFDKMVKLPFEHTEMPMPWKYHEAMTAAWGDYMKPVRGTSGHGYPFYGSMEAELERQIKAMGFQGTVDEFCRQMAAGG